MKNKNEVTGNLLLGCTVLRISPEVPGAVTTFLLEHAAGMPGYGVPIPAIMSQLPWNNKCLKICPVLSLNLSIVLKLYLYLIIESVLY